MPESTPLYHLTLVGAIHGNQTQNGYYFRPAVAQETPDHAANLSTIIARFGAVVMPYVREFAHQQWAFIAILGTTLIPRYGPIVEWKFEVGGGAQVGECLPSFNAGVLSLRTGFGGRSAHGRTYYPGVSALDCEQSRLTASSLTRLQGIGDALLTGFGASDADNEFHYGVFSPKRGRIPMTPPAVGFDYSQEGFMPVLQTIARQKVGTQRHRLTGHGP